MYTNIPSPRGWQGINGCIAVDVEAIDFDYFNEQMSEFREFMSEGDIEDIDLGWRSLCFQYESLESDPRDTFIDERFAALQDEWSLRRRLLTMTNPDSQDLASFICKNHLEQSPLNYSLTPSQCYSNEEEEENWDMDYTPH